MLMRLLLSDYMSLAAKRENAAVSAMLGKFGKHLSIRRGPQIESRARSRTAL